ncbi:hypothetical protein IJ556_03530 [bacterium]|nr:hypothetical protein [bacterium]
MTNERMLELFPLLVEHIAGYSGSDVGMSLKSCGLTNEEIEELGYSVPDEVEAVDVREFSVDAVKRAIQNGEIEFVYECRTTVCKIGGSWFFFLDNEENMYPQEYEETYSIDEQSMHVYDAIMNYDEAGLSLPEATYYKWYIMYHS